MGPAGKTACLLFLFTLVSPLFANDEEPPSLGDGPLFFEELFVFDGVFSLDEALTDEDLLPDEEAPAVEESLPDKEALPQPSPQGEGSPPDPQPSVEGEGSLSGEEAPPDREALPAEEAPPAEDGFEDGFIDDDDFFFEAPPLIFEAPTFEPRSFDDIFPNFSRRQRMAAMGGAGLRHSFVKDEPAALIPHADSGIDLFGGVMKKNPSHLIEALVVVPYNERELDLLDIYNALGRIENIKDYPATMNGNPLYVFTESSRLQSARNRKDIADPPPASALPFFSETMYLRLKEINFGNLFIRGDISISVYGITYSMTNFTDVRYFLVPMMKAERFVTIIYLEPVKEGVLIYSMTGFYLPGFIADRVNLTPNINRRIEIFIKWITDGLREQEGAAAVNE